MNLKRLVSPNLIVIGISILSIILGQLVLIGWYTNTIELIQVLPVFVPMQYNTALCFLLGGISLFLAYKKRFKLALGPLLVICSIGFLTLVEYTTGTNLGIDELFMKHYITVETSHPGRMAPNTALCFLLSGISIFLTFGKNIKNMQISSILGSLILGLGLIALIGYSIGMEVTYGGGKLTRMALHTSAGFLLLGAGITALNFSKEIHLAGKNSLTRNAGLTGYAFAFALVIFFIDLSIPLEVAIGIPYILFVLFGWFIKQEGITTILAICSTVLIIAGFLYSFTEVESSIVVINRIFAIMAVWLVAALLNKIKRNEKILNLTNQKLDKNIAQLQITNTELEQFSYIASHDLQEPLRTVMNFTQLFQDQFKSELNEEGTTYLRFISQASNRMSDLIKGLLDYSRLGHNKEMFNISLDTILKDLQVDLYTNINETNAILNIGTMPNLKGYKIELALLFQNLILNAIKFRKPTDRPEISISAEEKNNHYEFSVKDNGIGIAVEHQKKIFSIFQRLHKKNEYEGTGIGLAHCKKIVELHEGTINVSSIPNQGSNFVFTIKKN